MTLEKWKYVLLFNSVVVIVLILKVAHIQFLSFVVSKLRYY